MYRTAAPLFFVCESPLHAGSGKDLGIVDLPIQREGHTDFPKIEASSVKGALRESFYRKAANNPIAKANIELAFGPELGDLHAAALGFTDARLLLFPVKSVRGVFAWVTCPMVLRQLRSDFEKLEQPIAVTQLDQLPAIKDGKALLLNSQSSLPLGNSQKIILEEYAFDYTVPTVVPTVGQQPLGTFLADTLYPQDKWWREKLTNDLVILSDNDFKSFTQLSTEVVTRIKINPETGTVDNGALFTEEFLPSDSVLYSLSLFAKLFSDKKLQDESAVAQPAVDKTEDAITDQSAPTQAAGASSAAAVQAYFAQGLDPTIQLGGDATLGKGILRTRLLTSIPSANPAN